MLPNNSIHLAGILVTNVYLYL